MNNADMLPRCCTIFHEQDDVHVGFRFGTIEQATTFLNTLVVFEDVFSNMEIQHHN